MATIPPAEILEASYPVMFTQWALRPDSAGAGLHRGGLGAIYEIEALAPDGADAFLLGERGATRRSASTAAAPAALNRFIWQTDEGEASPPMASKVTDVKVASGQRVRLETPGGGGWGDPLDAIPRASRATSGSAMSRAMRRLETIASC